MLLVGDEQSKANESGSRWPIGAKSGAYRRLCPTTRPLLMVRGVVVAMFFLSGRITADLFTRQIGTESDWGSYGYSQSKKAD